MGIPSNGPRTVVISASLSLSLYLSVFVPSQPPTVLVASTQEGNGSHSVAKLSAALMDEGHAHTRTHTAP